MELLESYKLIAPLQKRVNELKENLFSLKVHECEGEKWTYGKFYQAYKDFRVCALREGKNVTEIDFYNNVIDELKTIVEQVRTLEKHYKHNKFHAIWESITDVKSIAESKISEFEKKESGNPQREINIEDLKKYLISEIFTKKGKQKNKADELIAMLKTERTNIEIAAIAKFVQENHLLKDKYKHSLSWDKWLSAFYDIAGVKKGYSYRINEVNNDNINNMLNGLFPKQKNNK
jgi:hypothetical protein